MQILKKLFENWNILKQKIHFGKNKKFFINKKEVRYTYTGINIGYESNGKGNDAKRPALVLKKIGNLFLVASLTTKGKDGNIFYYKLDDNYFGKGSYIMLSQIKVIDKNRFIKQIGALSGEDFNKIQKKIRT